MTIQINPIYNNILGWDLRSNEEELLNRPREVDFSLTERTWVDTAKTVVLVLLKIILFPWAIYSGIRWCVQRLVMAPLYPAQSWIVKKYFHKDFQIDQIDQDRITTAYWLEQDGFIVRHVALEKDGSRLSGLLIGKPETINNGNWVLQATGNGQPVEDCSEYAKKYHEAEYNVLLVNNPGVGRSEGTATPETIGECQRTAIQFLETALKAKNIVLGGYSLGGASIGQAILQHDFDKSSAKFFVVRQVTFARASEIVEELAPKWRFPACLAKCLVRWSGCEMDNVESSRKLAKFKIRELVIQGEYDDLIPFDISLAGALEKENIETKELLRIHAHHGSIYPILDASVDAIRTWTEQLEPLENAE